MEKNNIDLQNGGMSGGHVCPVRGQARRRYLVIGGGLPVSRSVIARAMREGQYIETEPDDRLPDLLHQKIDRSRDKCQKIHRKVMGQGHKRSGDILVKLCNGKEFRVNSAETELTVCGNPDGKKGEQK